MQETASAFLFSGLVIFVTERQFRRRKNKKKRMARVKQLRWQLQVYAKLCCSQQSTVESREFQLSHLKNAVVLRTHQGCSDVARLTSWKLSQPERKWRKTKKNHGKINTNTWELNTKDGNELLLAVCNSKPKRRWAHVLAAAISRSRLRGHAWLVYRNAF